MFKASSNNTLGKNSLSAAYILNSVLLQPGAGVVKLI